jgi:hypothetical protein
MSIHHFDQSVHRALIDFSDPLKLKRNFKQRSKIYTPQSINYYYSQKFSAFENLSQ